MYLRIEKLKRCLWSTLCITKPFMAVINMDISFPKAFVAVTFKIWLHVCEHSIDLGFGVNVCLWYLSNF